MTIYLVITLYRLLISHDTVDIIGQIILNSNLWATQSTDIIKLILDDIGASEDCVDV